MNQSKQNYGGVSRGPLRGGDDDEENVVDAGPHETTAMTAAASSRNGGANGSSGVATSRTKTDRRDSKGYYHSISITAASEDDSDDHDEGGEDFDDRPPTTSSLLVGRLLLFGVAFLYGTLNVTLRLVYALPEPPSASVLSTVRGWLAAACFLPFLWVQQRSERVEKQRGRQLERSEEGGAQRAAAAAAPAPAPALSLWIAAAELAGWNFGAQALVNVGLLWISSSARASFLTETSVVITPIIAAAAGHRPKPTVWVACAVAMVGLLALSHNDSKGGDQNSGSDASSSSSPIFFGIGDLFVLGGAVCWSMYIYRLSRVGGSYDEVRMQAVKTLLLACFYTSWFAASMLVREETDGPSLWVGWTDWAAWGLLLYSALGPGTVADIVQQMGQAAITSAAEANVILAMEPVFTSVLGFLLLGEAMTMSEYVGGGLLIGAAVLATI